MNKAVVGVYLAFTLFIVALSILTNIERHNYKPKTLKNEETTHQTLIEIDWRAIISSTSQFAEEQNENQLTISEDFPQETLSDSSIVAIVLGNPHYAILKSSTRTQKEITVVEGDSWIEDWKLDTILADRLIWSNNKTRKMFTQHLFNDLQVAPQNKKFGK